MQCAPVLRWIWMLSLEPAVQAAWVDLSLSPLAAHPHILEVSYLHHFPAKPLQLNHKYSHICTNRVAPLHCWMTAAAPHASPPRPSFQGLAPIEWACRSSLCSAWGSRGHHRPLCPIMSSGLQLPKPLMPARKRVCFTALMSKCSPLGSENSRWLCQNRTFRQALYSWNPINFPLSKD